MVPEIVRNILGNLLIQSIGVFARPDINPNGLRDFVELKVDCLVANIERGHLGELARRESRAQIVAELLDRKSVV